MGTLTRVQQQISDVLITHVKNHLESYFTTAAVISFPSHSFLSFFADIFSISAKHFPEEGTNHNVPVEKQPCGILKQEHLYGGFCLLHYEGTFSVSRSDNCIKTLHFSVVGILENQNQFVFYVFICSSL